MLLKNLSLLSLILLTACGFTPMNKLSDGYKTYSLTEQIEIRNIPNYEGFLLKNQLNNRLNPHKTNVAKNYTLTTYLKAPTYTDQSIQGDNFASRETISIRAKYQLKDKKTGKVILSDSTNVVGAYNIVKNPYATNVARNYLKDSLIPILADNISQRIISFLRKKEDLSESKTNTD